MFFYTLFGAPDRHFVQKVTKSDPKTTSKGAQTRPKWTRVKLAKHMLFTVREPYRRVAGGRRWRIFPRMASGCSYLGVFYRFYAFRCTTGVQRGPPRTLICLPPPAYRTATIHGQIIQDGPRAARNTHKVIEMDATIQLLGDLRTPAVSHLRGGGPARQRIYSIAFAMFSWHCRRPASSGLGTKPALWPWRAYGKSLFNKQTSRDIRTGFLHRISRRFLLWWANCLGTPECFRGA